MNSNQFKLALNTIGFKEDKGYYNYYFKDNTYLRVYISNDTDLVFMSHRFTDGLYYKNVWSAVKAEKLMKEIIKIMESYDPK